MGGTVESLGLSNVQVGLEGAQIQPARPEGHQIKYNQMYEEDDRPINASGHYNIPAYALDEIEIQEHFEDLDVADD